jgi:hypothetical protein
MATYLDYLTGAGETAATLGSGALAGLLGMPYGVYKGATSGKLGTREANRIAEKEAKRIMQQYTYQPRGQVAPQMMQSLGGLLDASKLPPVIPEAAMLASIPRQAVAAQAERTGMAAERAITPMVNRTMAKGGVGAGLLGDLAQGTRSPLDVYHGSPHGPFRKFDASKIGTGEGAQVYGYGHYLGEARGTGETYRDTLAYKAFDLDPEAKKLGLNLSAGTRGEFIRQTRANKSPEVLAKQLQNANIAARDLPQDKLAELFKAYNEKGGGYLYKVDLPDEQITKMLDWDKPMTEQEMISIYDRMQQSPLTGFAKTFQDNFYERMNRGQPTTDGQDLFMELSKELGGQKQVSDYLNSIGVPGIRYLDQMSRKPGVASLTQSQIDARINSLKSDIASGLGDQKRMKEILSSLEAERASHPKLTSNFVVFPGNENLLTIKEINDQPASLLFPTP